MPTLASRRRRLKAHLAQRRRSFSGFLSNIVDEVFIHRAWFGASFFQFIYLDEVRISPGELLVPKCIRMQLCLGNIFVLAALVGFQVHDRGFVGVGATDEVNSSSDTDAVIKMNLDILFREFDVLEPVGVIADVTGYILMRLGFKPTTQVSRTRTVSVGVG